VGSGSSGKFLPDRHKALRSPVPTKEKKGRKNEGRKGGKKEGRERKSWKYNVFICLDSCNTCVAYTANIYFLTILEAGVQDQGAVRVGFW
jgi:hypothetical protein